MARLYNFLEVIEILFVCSDHHSCNQCNIIYFKCLYLENLLKMYNLVNLEMLWLLAATNCGHFR